MKTVFRLLLGLSLAALIASAAGQSAVAVAAKNGLIAFESKRDGNFEIYVMNSDGSGQKRLTHHKLPDFDPSWSPNGKKIAFHRGREDEDKEGDIFVMTARGGHQVLLTRGPKAKAKDRNPSWSPDGRKLAFESNRDGNKEIFVMNSDGTGVKQLTQTALKTADGADLENVDPTWAPDGRTIAFASNRDGDYEIFVMKPGGSGQTNVTNNSSTEIGPSWSPDGTRLAFHSNRDGNAEIYISDRNGQTRLTNNPAQDYNPVWSPDGKKIAFYSDRSGDMDIWVMNANGSAPTNLTRSKGDDLVPDWQAVR